MLRSSGFSPLYLEHNPSKAYFLICRVLSGLGLNLGSCFLKQGKSKYVYISLHAALLLFDTEFGPFKDQEKTAAIRKVKIDVTILTNLIALIIIIIN